MGVLVVMIFAPVLGWVEVDVEVAAIEASYFRLRFELAATVVVTAAAFASAAIWVIMEADRFSSAAGGGVVVVMIFTPVLVWVGLEVEVVEGEDSDFRLRFELVSKVAV